MLFAMNAADGTMQVNGLNKEPIMRYRVLLEESEKGFAVSVPSLPGCHSQGETEREASENIADAIREYLEVVKEENQVIRVRTAK